jgi:hypothetical protein
MRLARTDIEARSVLQSVVVSIASEDGYEAGKGHYLSELEA